MTGSVFLHGIALALAAGIIHWAWWRLKRPQDDLKALAGCLVLIPCMGALGGFMTGWLAGTELLLALFLAERLGAAYLFWYPAAQAVSPTMLITILASRSGNDGLSEESLREAIPEETLTGDTLTNLFHEKFAQAGADGLVRLDKRGRRTLAAIRFLRRSAGFDEPKG